MGARGIGSRPKSKKTKDAPKLRKRLPWLRKGLSLPDQIIAFLNFLPVTSGALAGTRFKCRPFQEKFIRATFAEDQDGKRPVRRSTLCVARKNGKSALAAGLALCALCGPLAEARGQVISAAASKEQAALIFSELEAMIVATPEFDAILNIRRFHKTIEVLEGVGAGTVYKAISSDARTAHGLSPHFAIFDEYAQAKNDELWQALMTGQGARKNAVLITISTEAADDAAPMSRLVDYSKDVMAGKIEDPSTYLLHFGADLDDDIFDPRTWFKANPGLGDFRSMDDLQAQATVARQSASAEPAFRNYILNQRVASETRFVNRSEWLACDGEPHIEDGATVYAALDLSWSRDLTALVFVCPRPDGSADVLAEFFLPGEGLKQKAHDDRIPWDIWAREGYLTTCPGKVNDMRMIAARIGDAQRRWNVETLAFDRWGIELLRLELERAGITIDMSEFGQGYKSMSPAVDCLERHIAQAKLRHGGNPVLTHCASNAIVVRDPAGSRKLDKSRSAGKIDGLIALSMALQTAEEYQPEPMSAFVRQFISA